MQVLDAHLLADDSAALFRLLGDPTRILILQTLAATDEMCVHEIADAVGTTETKVSQALRLLRTAGVVRNRRDGRHIHYRLDDDHVRTLIEVTAEHLAHRDIQQTTHQTTRPAGPR